MTGFTRSRAVLAAVGCLAAVAVTQTAGASAQAGSSTAGTELQDRAQQQTRLLLKFYEGQNVSPSKCQQGQSSGGVDGVFLLPTLSFGPGSRTINCQITARSVLLDVGGLTVSEDNSFPESFYTFTDDGPHIPFTSENLEPICDDLIADGVLADLASATLDGDTSVTGTLLDSGVFTARVNRHAQIPGGADMYADSVALGHPGRLDNVFCGWKAELHLSPGTHTIVVDYGLFPGGDSTPTVFTYNITVKGGHGSR
jgi:hypothetical protein